MQGRSAKRKRDSAQPFMNAKRKRDSAQPFMKLTAAELPDWRHHRRGGRSWLGKLRLIDRDVRLHVT